MTTIRPEQRDILEYRGGKLAVSAVPGSGKTFTLALLATTLLRTRSVTSSGEILVVTFTNSAVDNIRGRIRAMLADQGLPDAGYRVYTLHGLASSIVKERPDLAGTSPDFRIDDELSGRSAMPDAVQSYVNTEAPDYWRSFLPADLSEAQRDKVEARWLEATKKIAGDVTSLAKNLRLTPPALRARIDAAGEGVSGYLRIGAAIYARYQAILDLGGRLDFDDLIWGAIRALENDDGFRADLGRRYQFVLEDEAQDSTPLQEAILSLLVRDHGNWVRVGDPNQAIMTTFTSSDVRFFRDFLRRPDVRALPLSRSGRSAPMILTAANRLAAWSANEHPDSEVRDSALTDDPPIRPTEPGDPQPNPSDADARLHVQAFRDAEDEIRVVSDHASSFVLENPGRTCAVLAPTNYIGESVVAALEAIESRLRGSGALANRQPLFQDQLKNASSVRLVARLLAAVVGLCANPTKGAALNDVREALIDLGQLAPSDSEARVRTLLRSAFVERLLFPAPVDESSLPPNVAITPDEERHIARLAARAERWVRASLLPIDQLVLAAAQDTLSRDGDLAIAHSLAVSLRRLGALNPDLQLADFALQLREIAENRQRYLSNALIEAGFEPVAGVITVTTAHKAKGLEWDRVYVLSVDQTEFPHDADAGSRGQQWYLDGTDPATVARKQLERLVAPGGLDGDATSARALERAANVEYIAERLRLLYVAVTRARSELILSHARRRNNRERQPALALRQLLGPV